MAKGSRGGKVGAGGSAQMNDDIKRAQERVESGKIKNVVDAFKGEVRKTQMGLFDRVNPYKDDKDIQRIAENEAVKEFLPDLGDSAADRKEYQNRLAQDHEFVYGSALLRSLPDKNGYATFEIPVTHTYWKGRTSTNGGIGSKRKKEEKIVKVRVNILEGQG